MKIVKVLVFFAVLCCCMPVWASDDGVIKMYGREQYGYNQPKYSRKPDEWKDMFYITAIADPDNFPISSREQGSVFSKIFADLSQKEHMDIIFYYPRDYKQGIENFERGKTEYMEDTRTVFGVYYENIPYSENEYIYPSFFENDVYLIMSGNKVLDAHTKDDLKKYKGIYVADDKFSSFVLKDIKSRGIKDVKNYSEAYRQLLSGNADFIAGCYYRSRIEAYKLGIRDYIVYSKTPVWKMPMFLRAFPSLARHPRLEYLKKYLKSPQYKKIRDEAFEELMDIYKENTKGVVPPTYISLLPEKEPAPDAENNLIPAKTSEGLSGEEQQ